jgi:hypothetical protein
MFCRKTLILTVLSLLMVSTLTATTIPISTLANQKLNQMPLAFTKNMGQWEDRVLFRANSGGATIWLTKEGVTYQFTRHVDARSGAVSAPGVSVGRTFLSNPGQAGMPILPDDKSEKDSIEQLVLTARFIGANPNPEVIAEGQMEYKCNYFFGNDPAKWHSDVPNYESITLRDIYPGIDLKYTGDVNSQVTYEYIVAPGADIEQIKIAYEGAEETSIDSDGRMILKTKWGDMIAAIKSPTNGVLSGSGSFSQISEKMIGFETSGASRQAQSSVAVVLVYSTYLGGSGFGGEVDTGDAIAVDGSGNAYVTGCTSSWNFPTSNPYQTTNHGFYNVFVTKLSSTGNSLIFSTFLGGTNRDYGRSIAVDGSGDVYVTGQTFSIDFPTLNPFQVTYQGGGDSLGDAFVTKVSSSGNNLIYSTYLGGENNDYGSSIAVDGNGSACVTGYTFSSNFPTENPLQAYQGPTGYSDAFVTRFSNSGNGLIFSTYLGGDSADCGEGIAVDRSGNVHVTGQTGSSDFPTLNPYQTTYQGGGNYWGDAFVTKLSMYGDGLIYSTYLGGEGYDYGSSIAVDSSGNAYVTGRTESSSFPIMNPYQAAFQGGYDDAFVTKLSSSGNNLIYSTYLGGGGADQGYGIAIDGGGNIYVAGYTGSSDFPTANPFQTYQGGEDAFVAKLSSAGDGLIYSTYLGGVANEWGHGIAIDVRGCAYVAGRTMSSSFPTQNPYQTVHGFMSAFVTKFGAFPAYLCGDANGDAIANISDAVYLIAFIFSGGPAPNPYIAGDANCDNMVNISDAVYWIAHIFAGGAAPCAGCK